MAQFQFKVGQQVQVGLLVNSVGAYSKRLAEDGIFTILRRLPSDTKEIQYRVRSEADGHERVIDETEIRAAVA